MNDDFRKNVLDDDGPEALRHCKEYARALVEIGDNQDELSGECRWAVKALRQKAGILMATDPRVAPVVRNSSLKEVMDLNFAINAPPMSLSTLSDLLSNGSMKVRPHLCPYSTYPMCNRNSCQCACAVQSTLN